MKDKKFYFVLVFVVLLALGLSACQPAPTPVPATEVPAPTKIPLKKVVLLTEDPIGINPYFITAQEGLKKAAQELGVEIKVIECNGDPTNMDENLRAAARENYDLYILMSFGFNDTLIQVAPTTPNKFYVCIDCGVDLTGLTNVRDLGFKSQEAAYLLGVAAGLLTKTNVVGSVGPVEMPFMTRWTIPFGEAAKLTNPNVTVLDTLWSGGWADPAKSKELALTMADKKADVINGAAAAGNPGIFEAAQERNFLSTGVDINECPKAPGFIIDSVVKRVDLAVYNSIDEFLKGTLTGGAIDYGLKEGGVDLAVFAWPNTDTKCVLAKHKDVMAKVEEVRKKIIDGEIKVTDPLTGQ